MSPSRTGHVSFVLAFVRGTALKEKVDGSTRLCQGCPRPDSAALLTEAQASLRAHSENGSCALKSGSSELRLLAVVLGHGLGGWRMR